MVQVCAWPDTEASVCAALASAIGMRPPAEPNRVEARGSTRVLWLGPHRWLVVTPKAPGSDLVGQLRALLPTEAAAVVDLGAGRRVFALSGPRARDVIAKELPIDLHPVAFPPGRCVQGLMTHVGVLVHAIAPEAYEIFVYRAFAQHFLEMLEDAAAEYSGAPAR